MQGSFRSLGDQPSMYSVVTPIINCYSVRGVGGVSIEARCQPGECLLAGLPLFQQCSLCLAQSQGGNPSTDFPLGLPTQAEAPAVLQGRCQRSAPAPLRAWQGTRRWRPVLGSAVGQCQPSPAAFTLVALTWRFFTELQDVQHSFGFT